MKFLIENYKYFLLVCSIAVVHFLIMTQGAIYYQILTDLQPLNNPIEKSSPQHKKLNSEVESRDSLIINVVSDEWPPYCNAPEKKIKD